MSCIAVDEIDPTPPGLVIYGSGCHQCPEQFPDWESSRAHHFATGHFLQTVYVHEGDPRASTWDPDDHRWIPGA